MGVTETNISYDYLSTAYTPASSQAAPGTFYAALWTADVMGAALEEGLWTLALWNIGDRAGDPAAAPLTLAVDALSPQTLDCPALSMTVVRIPDSADGGGQVLRYTGDIADARLPPQGLP